MRTLSIRKPSMKIHLEKGFKQFLLKTLIFVGLFVMISFIIGQKIVASSLLYGFKIFIYGGMGKVFLFSIFGFVLFYRDKLLRLVYYKYDKKNLIFILLSIISTISFYILELNINQVPINWTNIFFIHTLFLSIFIFLGLGVFGLRFIKYFYHKFKKELGYFLIFGIITYSLMNQVWKLWPYLSLIVSKITFNLLRVMGDTILIDQFTISFNGFTAKIGEACSGVYSIFIFSALYLFAVILDWKKLNKTKITLVFIPAIIGAFFVNIFRVSLFFIVGSFVSEELAVGLYHSYTGMILFLIYFTIFWLLFYEWMKKPEFKSKQGGFIKRKCKEIMCDSLYKNSIYLMMSTLVMSFFGFVFWMIVTRLYSTYDVGIATTIISVMGLITGLSVLGLNVGLIRFLPTAQEKNKKINTCFTLVALASIIISTIFLLGLNLFSPKLLFIKENMIIAFTFIFFMIISGLNSITESIFIAFRNAKYVLIKNTVFSFLKLVFPFLFVFLGAYGIFSSYMLSLTLGLVTVLIILISKFGYNPKFVFYDKIIKKIGKYSLGNYVAGFIGGLPIIILPIMITNMIGPETTAYYYISMMIATLLFTIPQATTQSLFAEGSYNEKELKTQVKKAVKIIATLLIPGIIVIVLFGEYILLAFGSDYSEQGFRFLQILAVSGLFVSVNNIFGMVFRVRKEIGKLLLVSVFRLMLIVGGVYLLLEEGLLGIGVGWMIGVIATSLVYVVFSLRK